MKFRPLRYVKNVIGGVYRGVLMAGIGMACLTGCSEDPYTTPDFEGSDPKIDNIVAFYSKDKVEEMSEQIGVDLLAPENHEKLKEVTLAHIRGRFYNLDKEKYWEEAAASNGAEVYDWIGNNLDGYWESSHTVSKKDNIEIHVLERDDYDQIPSMLMAYPYGKIDVYLQRMHGSRGGVGIEGESWDVEEMAEARDEYPGMDDLFAEDADVLASNCDLSLGYEEGDNTAAEALAELFQRSVYASEIPVYHHFIGSMPNVETMYHYGSFSDIEPGRLKNIDEANDSIRSVPTQSGDIFRYAVDNGVLQETTRTADIYRFGAGSVAIDGVTYDASVTASDIKKTGNPFGSPLHSITLELIGPDGRKRHVYERGLDGVPDHTLHRSLDADELEFGGKVVEAVHGALE